MGIFDLFKKKKATTEFNRAFDVRKVENKVKPETENSKPQSIATESEKLKKEKYIFEDFDGKKLKYKYNDVAIFTPEDLKIDLEMLEPGNDLYFIKEPQNPYDNKAVAVYENGRKIGYMYRTVIKDMVNDYIDADCPVLAHISSIDDEEQKIRIFIAFYGSTFSKTIDSKLVKSGFIESGKEYKLTGNRNEIMQEYISCMSAGEEVELEYDFDKEKYLVYGIGGLEIGYLPKAAEKYEDREFVISRIEEDEELVYTVYLRVI